MGKPRLATLFKWAFYLNCDGQITAVSTDAHRLAVANLPINSDHSFLESYQEKSINEMAKFI